MIKSIFIIGLFFSHAVFAAPSVGDKAVYVGNFSGIAFEQSVELIAYDEATGSFMEVRTSTSDGEKEIEKEWRKTDEIFSADEGKATVSQCGSNGGVLEEISIGSDNIKTCRFPTNGGSANFGEVPFGIVKIRNDGWEQDLVRWESGR